MRFSGLLLTTLAVQKCCFVPVVKNSAPTVGTPAKCVGEGIPGGGPTGPPAAGVVGRGVAAASRAGVQNAAAACCAGAQPRRDLAWRFITPRSLPVFRGVAQAAGAAPVQAGNSGDHTAAIRAAAVSAWA